MASSDRPCRGVPPPLQGDRRDEPYGPRVPLVGLLPGEEPGVSRPPHDQHDRDDAPGPDEERFLVPLHPRRHGPLPFGVRVGIFLLGWLLILIGIAGLVLPGIQGVFTIVLGAALLSLDNELVYRLLRRCLQRWPSIWLRVESFRDKLHRKLHRFRRHH